ncbi:carboxypeptidase-like regulatory domain-containing protein [Flavihumibacter rivuli]|uniref:carboxypeptidase-like regulatory domain-containing protein n=1 Tax=Flavihumibacter rivuli TaxID=2838156 RepID=UPI001BDE25AB|nr:carboxypeptidase-like regulatory domain-containing protein [Flavihumibacter rivuli]ULQ56955.1 carboxypeptidase-like regulatory domain-containing protein [Flavihumibacter rivuli]
MHGKIVLLLALLVTISCSKSGSSNNGEGRAIVWPSQTGITPVIEGAVNFSLSATDDHLNVMENTMPRMPNYPQVKAKKNRMSGFVADLAGRPLAGAYIGLRTPGTVYVASSAITDQDGYYDMEIPLGGADIHAAGYTIEYGQGQAAMSLYPADGNVAVTNAEKGVVKHFVMLSYGLADPAKRASEPWSAAGYFGGSLRFDYVLYDAMWDPKGLPFGAEIVLKLSPVAGSTLYAETRSFTITRKVGNGINNFIINNIPVGIYTITASLKSGTKLRMRNTGSYVSVYPNHGLQPRSAVETAKLLFTAMDVDKRTANVNFGNWRPVNITLELP